jgi:hypothetical protein
MADPAPRSWKTLRKRAKYTSLDQCEVNLRKDKELAQLEKPAYSREDVEPGKIVLDSRWLKEVGGRWPGDEFIEELLEALNNH